MLIAYWSVKGGSGTTVVAAAHALHLAARSQGPVYLADLAGEVPAVLGVPDPVGPGLADWLAADRQDPDSLFERCTCVAGEVWLLHRGRARIPDDGDGDALAAALAGPARGGASTEPVTVVADCGVPHPGSPGWALAAGADHSLLVLRPCYLAMRRAVSAPLRPSSVVLVVEPGRALGRHDVEDVLGVPVGAEVPWDPAIARAVDAGLLASRVPRPLERAIRLGAVA